MVPNFKSIFTGALVCMAMVLPIFNTQNTMSASAVASEETLWGDVNGDGSVDSSDASLILEQYSKVSTGGLSIYCNSNGDRYIKLPTEYWVSEIAEMQKLTVAELISLNPQLNVVNKIKAHEKLYIYRSEIAPTPTATTTTNATTTKATTTTTTKVTTTVNPSTPTVTAIKPTSSTKPGTVVTATVIIKTTTSNTTTAKTTTEMPVTTTKFNPPVANGPKLIVAGIYQLTGDWTLYTNDNWTGLTTTINAGETITIKEPIFHNSTKYNAYWGCYNNQKYAFRINYGNEHFFELIGFDIPTISTVQTTTVTTQPITTTVTTTKYPDSTLVTEPYFNSDTLYELNSPTATKWALYTNSYDAAIADNKKASETLNEEDKFHLYYTAIENVYFIEKNDDYYFLKISPEFQNNFRVVGTLNNKLLAGKTYEVLNITPRFYTIDWEFKTMGYPGEKIKIISYIDEPKEYIWTPDRYHCIYNGNEYILNIHPQNLKYFKLCE